MYSYDKSSLFMGIMLGITVAPFFYMAIYWLAKKLDIVGYAPQNSSIDDDDDPDWWRKGKKRYEEE